MNVHRREASASWNTLSTGNSETKGASLKIGFAVNKNNKSVMIDRQIWCISKLYKIDAF